jgi:hypothetical protein
MAARSGADQLPGGSVPFVVPDALTKMRSGEANPARASGAAAWSDAAVICPWVLYQSYGDTRLLEEQYESMSGIYSPWPPQLGLCLAWLAAQLSPAPGTDHC